MRTHLREHGHFYAGVDIGFYNETELEDRGSAIEDSSDLSDLSYNLVDRYEFNTHDVVKSGIRSRAPTNWKKLTLTM